MADRGVVADRSAGLMPIGMSEHEAGGAIPAKAGEAPAPRMML
jgi:hypothetical protein